MILVSLPHTGPYLGEKGRRLVFYLAMEEFVAANLGRLVGDRTPSRAPLEAFFLWQVPPTVIFGRNQVMEAEVNLPFCRERGIETYRRKSGGGCVYADWGNIMCSFVTDATDVGFTFDRYLRRIALTLRRLGLNAERSGRNDVLVEGRKVSGNAFFRLPECSIVHGTLLFESDFTLMERAITPSAAKITSKGVPSVRQRVANLREELEAVGKGMEIDRFKRFLVQDLCSDEVMLTEADIEAIEAIEATYLDPAFLEGRNHRFTVEKKGKIEGAGEFSVALDVDDGKVRGVSVSGDYFPLESGDGRGFEAILAERLNGVEFTEQAISDAFTGIDLKRYVMGLETKEWIKLLTE